MILGECKEEKTRRFMNVKFAFARPWLSTRHDILGILFVVFSFYYCNSDYVDWFVLLTLPFLFTF